MQIVKDIIAYFCFFICDLQIVKWNLIITDGV